MEYSMAPDFSGAIFLVGILSGRSASGRPRRESLNSKIATSRKRREKRGARSGDGYGMPHVVGERALIGMLRLRREDRFAILPPTLCMAGCIYWRISGQLHWPEYVRRNATPAGHCVRTSALRPAV